MKAIVFRVKFDLQNPSSMTILGNLFLGLAALLYLAFLKIVYGPAPPQGGDAAGQYPFTVVLLSLLLFGALSVAALATGWKEGFSWILHRLAWEAGLYGYEAAYSGWVRLYINGDLKGVFVNAEQRDAQFLRNHGYNKESGTWLYKIDGSAALEVGIGDSPAFEHLCYSPFNSGPGSGFSPGGGGGGTQPNLEADLPQWVDMQGMLTMAAVHAFSANRDDLFSHSGKIRPPK